MNDNKEAKSLTFRRVSEVSQDSLWHAGPDCWFGGGGVAKEARAQPESSGCCACFSGFLGSGLQIVWGFQGFCWVCLKHGISEALGWLGCVVTR